MISYTQPHATTAVNLDAIEAAKNNPLLCITIPITMRHKNSSNNNFHNSNPSSPPRPPPRPPPPTCPQVNTLLDMPNSKIWTVEDFLTEQECEHLIKHGTGRLKVS